MLLTAGDEPLIIKRAGPAKVLETSLDFGSAQSARRPETPLLVNLMFEQLLDDHLLDQIAIADRGAGSAMVAPLDRAGAIADSGRPSDSRALRNSARPLLVAALLVLLWEMIALGRQWYRSSDFAGAPT